MILACRVAQILHYFCSFVTFLSCFLLSYSLNIHEENQRNVRHDIDIYSARPDDEVIEPRALQNRPIWMFTLDMLCLVWAIAETILRTFSTPSLLDYFTSLGFFDITGLIVHRLSFVSSSKIYLGVACHFIYIFMIVTAIEPP